MQAVPSSDWLVISGHHPIDEVDVLDFTSLIQKYPHFFIYELLEAILLLYFLNVRYPVNLYMNGHAHSLTQYTIDNKGAYITTGAGSLVNTASQSFEHTAAKVQGVASLLSSSGHSYQTGILHVLIVQISIVFLN